MRWLSYRSTLAAATLVFALSGCRDATHAELTLATVVGTWETVAMTGSDAPANGHVVFTADSRVERRVSYASSPAKEYVSYGLFTLRQPDTIDMVFRGWNGETEYSWHVLAIREGKRLVIRYSGPADGPIVEIYRRR